MNKKISILIIDDHPAMRHGIAQLVGNEPEFYVCGEAGNRSEALEVVKNNRPDFIILDIALKDEDHNGLDLISEIHSCIGPVPILIYSMHDEMIYAEEALRKGAHGFLMKQEPVRQILTALHRILDGGVFVSEPVNRNLLLHHIGQTQDHFQSLSPKECLSEREMDVFRLIGKGMPPREIARILCCSPKTIETHRKNIRKKLVKDNASELTHYAIEWAHQKF